MKVNSRIKLASLVFLAGACAPSSQEGKTCQSAMGEAGINTPRAVSVCEKVLEKGNYASPNEASHDVMAELVHDGVLAEAALNHERLVIVRHQFDKDALPLGMNKEGW